MALPSVSLAVHQSPLSLIRSCPLQRCNPVVVILTEGAGMLAGVAAMLTERMVVKVRVVWEEEWT